MSEFSKGFKSRRPNKSFYDPAFASGWWVYGTLILSWCLDLLPLSHLPYFPSFLVLTLVFWTIHQPQRIYYWLAFLFGLLTDADTGAVFGQHALTYCMVVFFTELMSVRLSWLSSLIGYGLIVAVPIISNQVNVQIGALANVIIMLCMTVCSRFAECRILAGVVLAPRAPMGS